MIGTLDRTILTTLVREEWRLHARLFGGRRFTLFPLVLATLVGAGSSALVWTGTDPAAVVVGLHLLVFCFGLYSGTAGFVGSDMLENLLGDLTLVLASSTTLPLSRRRLLGLFLLKDGGYYSILFVLPITLGAGPLLEGSWLSLLATLTTLWLSLALVFAGGMVLTVAAIAVRTRGVPGSAIVGVAILGAGVSWWQGWLPVLAATPLGTGGSAVTAAMIGVSTLVIGTLAVAGFDPQYSTPTRTATDRFGRLDSALPGTENALVAKTLLDLSRSSGGLWKPFVSAGILLVLVGALVGVVESITGLGPAPGLFFGGVLGLSAFTTYNWLTQFDAVESYLIYPISVTDIFEAKRTAFVLIGTPTVVLPYLLAVILFQASLLDAAVGAVVLAGYGLYYYGLTVWLAGFDPNEFLFDGVRFSAFTLGVAIPLVPTLVAGFVVVPLTPAVAVGCGLAGVALGAIGGVLSQRAGPRWERRYRQDG